MTGLMTISLWQPWATAAVLGVKGFETRHWKTPHRGDLAIHAARKWSRSEADWWAALRRQDDRWPETPPLGAIVGVVELVEIVPTEQLVDRISDREASWGNYGPKRFGWRLARPRMLIEPVVCRGNQSMWRLDEAMSALVRDRIAA